jgi:hypothetical protein
MFYFVFIRQMNHKEINYLKCIHNFLRLVVQNLHLRIFLLVSQRLLEQKSVKAIALYNLLMNTARVYVLAFGIHFQKQKKNIRFSRKIH